MLPAQGCSPDLEGAMQEPHSEPQSRIKSVVRFTTCGFTYKKSADQPWNLFSFEIDVWRLPSQLAKGNRCVFLNGRTSPERLLRLLGKALAFLHRLLRNARFVSLPSKLLFLLPAKESEQNMGRESKWVPL